MSEHSATALNAFNDSCSMIRDEYDKMGGEEGKDLAARIIRGLQVSFDSPPIAEFENVLRKRFTPDEVRVAIFQPQDEQIGYYPLLLLAAEAASEGHPLNKLQGLLLSTIFLLHKRRWSFLEEFVARGGLEPLANLLICPNLYFRGQVIEIFTCITDCDSFDWFAPPTLASSQVLHVRMLELNDHVCFLESLLRNRSESYPGGSARCLQILAFWLSWVRALYTQDRRLSLSRRMLAELAAWAEGRIDQSVQNGGIETSVTPEEQQLAHTLWKDFGTDQYEGCTSPPTCTTPLRKEAPDASSRVVEVDEDGMDIVPSVEGSEDVLAVGGVVRPPFNMQAALCARTANAKGGSTAPSPNSPGPSPPLAPTVADLRTIGSKLFQDGLYEAALDVYTKGLEIVTGAGAADSSKRESGDIENEDGDVQAVIAALHYNRAAALWKIAHARAPSSGDRTTGNRKSELNANSSGSQDDDSTAVLSEKGKLDLQQCESACREAVRICPGHHKAAYRLAAVLLSLGKLQEAMREVNIVLERGKGGCSESSIAESEQFHINALLTMKHKITAAALVRGISLSSMQGSSGLQSQNQTGGSKVDQILAALQRRKARESSHCTHAFSGTWTPPEEPTSYTETPSSTGMEPSSADLSLNTATGITHNVSAATSVPNVAAPSVTVTLDAWEDMNQVDSQYTRLGLETANKTHTLYGKIKAVPAAAKIRSGIAVVSETKKVSAKAAAKAAASRASEQFSRLKKCAAEFEKLDDASKTSDVGAAPDASIISRAVECLQGVWAEGITLSSVPHFTLEEPLLLLLLQVAVAQFQANQQTISGRLLSELGKCGRLQSTLSMAMHGHDGLRAEVKRVAYAAEEPRVIYSLL